MNDMFQFQQFSVRQDLCAMKVGTDGVLLGAWAQLADCQLLSPQLLDIGTGTGIIALMLAQRFQEARVVAIDMDEGAVRQTAENVAASPFQGRIDVQHITLQTFSQLPVHQGRYDAIVSNPPFFVDSMKAPDGQRSMARHADTLSYHDLMTCAWRLLNESGELSIIIPFDHRRRMDDEAVFQGFFPSRICAVRTTPQKSPRRYLLAYRKHPCPCLQQELVIGDEAYRQLTEDFYLTPFKNS